MSQIATVKCVGRELVHFLTLDWGLIQGGTFRRGASSWVYAMYLFLSINNDNGDCVLLGRVRKDRQGVEKRAINKLERTVWD